MSYSIDVATGKFIGEKPEFVHTETLEFTVQLRNADAAFDLTGYAAQCALKRDFIHPGKGLIAYAGGSDAVISDPETGAITFKVTCRSLEFYTAVRFGPVSCKFEISLIRLGQTDSIQITFDSVTLKPRVQVDEGEPEQVGPEYLTEAQIKALLNDRAFNPDGGTPRQVLMQTEDGPAWADLPESPDPDKSQIIVELTSTAKMPTFSRRPPRWGSPRRSSMRYSRKSNKNLKTKGKTMKTRIITIIAMLSVCAVISGCATEKIAEGLTTKNTSGNGTVIESHIGINTDTKIPELRTLFISGDIATVKAGTNAVSYREESSSSVWNASSITKKRFLAITLTDKGDVPNAIRAVAEVFKTAESKPAEAKPAAEAKSETEKAEAKPTAESKPAEAAAK